MHVLLDEHCEGGSPCSSSQPCFASQRLVRLDMAVSGAPAKAVCKLPTCFSILLCSRKNWLICAIKKQQGEREGWNEKASFLPS